MRHLLDIDDLATEELEAVLAAAADSGRPQPLAGQGVALVFEKPSARTRSSMELAVVQLGGHPVTIRPDEIGIDVRESAEDVVCTLGCYHAVVCARVFEHAKLARMAAASTVPVVNLLSDEAHPMQALADVLTIRETFPAGGPLTVAYVGDANNVAQSLALACGRLGMTVRVASPPGYGFSDDSLARLTAADVEVEFTEDPYEGVAGAQVIYTDVWASMGQEDEAARRRRDFAGFTVDAALLEAAADDAVLLHCLPAHRGEEVATEVLDGPRSRVWQQATNRMHAARGLLRWLKEQA